MALPVVAIVGRPNVGKSSLFNRLARKRTSIVEPTAGVTRDRVSAVCDIDDLYFELVDTGGHGVVDRDDLSEHVERQIRYAIDQADLILFVVDARDGVTPLDQATAELLRRQQVSDHVRLLANKVDEPKMEDLVGEFTRLGFGEALPVSAASGLGRTALAALIHDALAETAGNAPPDPVMKVALVGKRNSGKSTFVNALVGEERVIVSEIPGTTRDSIDVRVEKDGRSLMLIDTAGVRKKKSIADAIEFFAYTRVTRSIQRADVVLFLIDAAVPVGQVDKRLARIIADEHKPCILVVNKWDLAKDRASTEDYGKYLTKLLPEMHYAPISFTTATQGRNTVSTLDLAAELFKQASKRVGTGVLNQMLRAAIEQSAPKGKRGRRAPKLLYATQVSSRPPTIVIFVNDAARVTNDYERYLRNRMRELLPYGEIPIRLLFRSRRQRGASL